MEIKIKSILKKITKKINDIVVFPPEQSSGYAS